jgi:hypothetical protein
MATIYGLVRTLLGSHLFRVWNRHQISINKKSFIFFLDLLLCFLCFYFNYTLFTQHRSLCRDNPLVLSEPQPLDTESTAPPVCRG